MLAIVKSSFFNGKDDTEITDKWGNRAVRLTPIAGKFPIKLRVIAGTVAINSHIETGRTYLVHSKFVRINIVGKGANAKKFPQYSIRVIQELAPESTSITDFIKATNELGDVVDIDDNNSSAQRVNQEEAQMLVDEQEASDAK